MKIIINFHVRMTVEQTACVMEFVMNMQILRKNEISIEDLKEKYYKNDEN